MTIKRYINEFGLQYNCFPGVHRALTVVIGFKNNENMGDETEFSVIIGDSMIKELDELFSAFCNENNINRNTVTHISVIRAAETMQELIMLES